MEKICTTDSISLSIKSCINGQAEYTSGCRSGCRAVTQAGCRLRYGAAFY